MEQQVKSGIYTTEFWITAFSAVVGVLATLGVITAVEAETAVGEAAELVSAAIVLYGIFTGAVKPYIEGRNEVKVSAADGAGFVIDILRDLSADDRPPKAE